jgi:hypothetical protein
MIILAAQFRGADETIYCPKGAKDIPENPWTSAIPLRAEFVDREREKGKYPNSKI